MINVGSIVAGLDLDTGDFFTKFKKAQRESESFGGKVRGATEAVGDLGKALTLGVTAPLVGLGGGIIKTSSDFEAGMSQVQAITGANTEEMQRLTDKAKEMGATTRFSARDSADAMIYMGMAGWKTQEVIDGLPGVMDLAAASGENLAMVSDIVTDALTAFGMEAQQATEFADLLAHTSRSSNTNVAMLGESFKYVAPVAGSFGYTAEDVALTLGLMADNGVKGSHAGTALRMAMIRLAKPTDASAKLLEEMGISLTDNNGNMKSWYELLVELRAGFAKLTPEQKASYSATIFGTQASTGMLAVLNSTEESFENLTEVTRNYDGAAKEMAETMQDNLSGRFIELKSKLEGVALQLGETLLPMAEDGVELLTRAVDWFSKLDGETQEAIVKAGLLAAAIGPVLFVGSKLVGGLISIVSIGGKVLGGAKALAGALGALGAGTGIAGAGAGGLSTALAGLGAVINPVTLGIGATALAGYELHKYLSEDATPSVIEFGEVVDETTAESIENLQELNQAADIELDGLRITHTQVTDDIYNNTMTKYRELTEEILSEIEQRREDELEQLQIGMSAIYTITQEEKEQILEATESKYSEMEEKTVEGLARIDEIVRSAAEENREMTLKEYEEIKEIQEQMYNNVPEILAQSAEEEKTIRETIKENAEALETEKVQELLKRAIEERDGKIEIANEEYERLAETAELIKISGVENADEKAEEVLKFADLEKREAIRIAEEEHKGVLGELKTMAGEQVNTIDWSTGESLSRFKQMWIDLNGGYDDWSGKNTMFWEGFKKFTNRNLKEIETDLNEALSGIGESIQRTEDSINESADIAWAWLKEYIIGSAIEIKDDVVWFFGEMKEGVTEKMSELPGAIEEGLISAKNNIANKYEDFKTAGKNIAINIANGIWEKINVPIEAIQDLTSGIRGYFPFSPAKYGPLKDLHKLKFGETISDAIYKGEPIINSALTDVLDVPRMNFQADRPEASNILPERANEFGKMRDLTTAFTNALRNAGGKEVVINLDGREVARVVAPYVQEENDRIEDYKLKSRGGEIW